jgi:prepilin-type N-terminal cleavage/methylation domain-containing protein
MNSMKTIFKKGFTLTEMLIYVAILSMLMVVVISTLVTMTRSYNTLKVSKQLNHAAVASMERMTREIRSAQSIVTAQSTFDGHPGRLYLQIASATTTEFFVDGGVLKLNQNGSYVGPLTSNEVQVTGLVFNRITTANSEAVRINLTLESTAGDKTKTETFYGTAVMRGSY